ncbi:hypothetical protein FRC05_004578 [Tulasnella sp. 425]|nr:hypothetical protein FRC05_004578 [Tulasnella sp. 425]
MSLPHVRRAIDADGENLNGDDGALPCGPCQRAHAYQVRTRPTAAPDEPSCVYDHPDLVADGPKGRIANLESEIAELRELLDAANAKLRRCTCGAALTVSTTASDLEGFSESNSDNAQHISSAARPLEQSLGTIDSDSGVIETIPETPVPTLVSSSTPAGTSFPSNSLGSPSNLPTPTIPAFDSNSFGAEGVGSGTFDVFPAAWPPNLPSPTVLYHLVETFFTSVPLASRLVHKPTFMIALQQLPTSLDFPHVALIHAICGLASLYSPIIADPKLDRAKANAAGGLFGPNLSMPVGPADGIHGKNHFPKTLYDLRGDWDEGFGIAHIRLASMGLRLSVQEGDRLLQVLQA